jgi:hypothetical protein
MYRERTLLKVTPNAGIRLSSPSTGCRRSHGNAAGRKRRSGHKRLARLVNS